MWSDKRIYFGLLCLLACQALAQSRAGSVAQTFRMSGIAVDASSGQPLSGVEVSTGPAEGNDPGQKMTTAEDGRFAFMRLRQGKYWLIAERHGYMRQSFEEHEEFSSAIAVGPSLKSSDLIFRLRPDASISGTITDETGEPIRNAQVMLFHDAVEGGSRTIHQRGSTGTDDQGHYHFGHVIPGRFFIAVWAQPWYAQQAQQTQNVRRYGNARNA